MVIPRSGRIEKDEQILKFVGAMLLSMVAGMVTIMMVESINMVLYPAPKGMNFQDPNVLHEYIQGLPGTPSLFLDWLDGGSFVAAFLARWLSPDRWLLPAMLASGCIFAASLVNLWTFPSPVGLWIGGLAGCAIGGHFGAALAAPECFTFQTIRNIDAPLSRVFQILSQVDEFSKAVPESIKSRS